MRILKLSVAVVLLLFVGATVGLLIAQEVAHVDSLQVGEGLDIGAAETAAAGATADEAEPAVPDGVTGSTDEPEEAPAATSSEAAPAETSTAEEADAVEADSPEPVSHCVVDAIYFHNTARCRTCRRIEEAARAGIRREI
jgi:hypothetical protein